MTNYYYELPAELQMMTEDFADKAIYEEYFPIHKEKMTTINAWFKKTTNEIDDYNDIDQETTTNEYGFLEPSCYSHEAMKPGGRLNHLPFLS